MLEVQLYGEFARTSKGAAWVKYGVFNSHAAHVHPCTLRNKVALGGLCSRVKINIKYTFLKFSHTHTSIHPPTRFSFLLQKWPYISFPQKLSARSNEVNIFFSMLKQAKQKNQFWQSVFYYQNWHFWGYLTTYTYALPLQNPFKNCLHK